jgi:DNA polymerase II large subunit
MASGVSITIEGQAHSLDDFSLGDLEWLEEYVGKPLDDLANLSSMKALVGFVFLVKRRTDSTYTVEQAREVKLATVQAEDDEPEETPRPTKRAAKGSAA